MKRTVPKNRNKKSTYGKLQFNSIAAQYFGLATLILIGILIGTLMASHSGSAAKTNFAFFLQNMFSKDAVARGFLNLFLSSFFSSSILLCIAFFFGLCALGLPIQLVLPVFKGTGIGLAMGYVYAQYGLKGLIICAVFILPQSLLISFAIIIASREGIRFSIFIALNVFQPQNQRPLWSDFCRYCFKYVICFIIILLASLLEATLSICFTAIFFS